MLISVSTKWAKVIICNTKKTPCRTLIEFCLFVYPIVAMYKKKKIKKTNDFDQVLNCTDARIICILKYVKNNIPS